MADPKHFQRVVQMYLIRPRGLGGLTPPELAKYDPFLGNSVVSGLGGVPVATPLDPPLTCHKEYDNYFSLYPCFSIYMFCMLD